MSHELKLNARATEVPCLGHLRLRGGPIPDDLSAATRATLPEAVTTQLLGDLVRTPGGGLQTRIANGVYAGQFVLLIGWDPEAKQWDDAIHLQFRLSIRPVPDQETPGATVVANRVVEYLKGSAAISDLFRESLGWPVASPLSVEVLRAETEPSPS